MKKLMTMIAAVATAFGLFADDANFYGNSFETAQEGVSGDKWGVLTPWSSEIETFDLGAYAQGEPANVYTDSAKRRDGSDGQDPKLPEAQSKFLKLETGKDTLDLGVADGQVYLDQLVKFTGFEEEQTEFAADTKIAVWLSAIEQEGTDPEADGYVAGETNLYVTVGTGATSTKVQIDPASVGLTEFLPETWYRVTIKSIGNVISGAGYAIEQQLGFFVFINGVQATIVEGDKSYHNYPAAFGTGTEAAKAYAAGQLFTAIDTASAAFATVSYQGIGAIDDVVLSQESPDFDSKVQFTIADMAGVELVKVTDAEGNELEQYLVMPGSDVRIYIKAKDGYRIDGLTGEYVTKTVTTAGQVITFTDEDFTVVEGIAKITRDSVDYIVGTNELEAAIAQVQDGDLVTFLKYADLMNGVYQFDAGTTVAVAEHGVWTVNVPGAGTLTDKLGAMPKKNIIVTFGDDAGTLQLAGTIYRHYSVATRIEAVNGSVKLVGALSIGNVYTNVATDAGAILKAETITTGKYKIALVDNGKVTTKTDLSSKITVPEGKQFEVVDGEDGWKTYQIKQATGFAIILASGPVYYNTLQDAINAALTGQTVTIMDTATFDSYVQVAGKEITLDLNGNTLTYIGATDPHCAICIHNGAGLTVDDSTVGKAGVLDGGDCLGAIQMTFKGDDSTNPAKLTVEAGKIVGKNYAVSGNGDRPNTEVVINGGWLLGTAVDDSAGIYNPQAGKLIITGGRIEGATGVYIKAGEIDCTISSKAEIVAVGSKRDHQNVGRFESTGDAIVVDNAGYPGGEPKVDIAGGKFESANAAAVASYAKTGLEPIAGFVTGGTFTGQFKIDDALAGGTYAFGPFTPGEEQTMVEAVAKIGTVNYGTLDAAIAAAAEDDTVTLVKDLTLTATLDIVKPVSIDLNQKTVTFAANLATGIYAHDAGEIVIENGKFAVADGRTNIAGSKAIYFLRTSAEFTNVEIDAPGFDYVLTHMGNIADQGKNRSEYWTTEVPYTLDCDKVAVKGNGSLFHLEYVKADLDSNCTATQYTDKGYFSEAHQAAIYSSCGAVVTVNGGTYSAVNALQTGNLGGDIIVKGGEFNGNIKSWMLDVDTRDFANVNKANIQIDGGKFTGNFVYADNCSEESPLLTVVISGGDFSDTEIPTAFIKPEEHKVAKWVDSTIPDYVTPGYDDETFDITFTDAAEWTNVVKTVYNQTPVAPTAPTKEGYEFKGWDKEIVPATEATTYTAQYTANTYGINYTWVDNDGAAVTALDNTLPENFTFGGDAIELKAEMVTLTEAYTAVAFTPDTVTTDEAKEFAVTVTLTKKADEPKVDPEQPIPVPTGKTAEQVAEEMNQKGIANYLNIPTVVTDETAYTAMFEAKADGKGAVIIDLKSDVKKEIADQLANEETSGSMLNPDATTSEVTITAKPGLFYGIKAVGDVTAISTANGQNWVQAAGNSVNVVRPTVEGNAAFFQAVCSPKNPQSNPAN